MAGFRVHECKGRCIVGLTLLTCINQKNFSYRLQTNVKPLIWVESIIERHSHSRVEYMIKCKSQFKRRSTANNVVIEIPVPVSTPYPPRAL